MTLTYNCVICGRKIWKPICWRFTCRRESCERKYRNYLLAMHRKIFKLRKVKESIKRKQ